MLSRREVPAEASFVWTAVEANGEVQSQAAREAADAQAQAVWDNLQPATRNDDLDRADPAGVAVAGGWHAIDNFGSTDGSVAMVSDSSVS